MPVNFPYRADSSAYESALSRALTTIQRFKLMARFELLGGRHAERCPKTGKRIKYAFTKGKITVVHSNRNLDELFGPTNFRRLEDGRGHDSAPPAAQPEPSEVEAAEGPAEAGDPEPATPALGADVTAEFKGADDADLLVFQDADGGYHVAAKDVPAKRLHTGAFGSKSEVRSFVKKHVLSTEG